MGMHNDSTIGDMTLGQLTDLITNLIKVAELDKADAAPSPQLITSWQDQLNAKLKEAEGAGHQWKKPTNVFPVLARRKSQSDSRRESYEHGSTYVIGEFTSVIEHTIIERAALATAQMMDSNEELDMWIDLDEKWRPDVHWEDHAEFTADHWHADVAMGHTRLGYKDWVNANLTMGSRFQDPNR